ncbi:hypothetical protein B5M09_008440 [Aphanomyces astaci]|uniref:No apical meristem-associated C-terminal domain-containing protein n=1 Tax=Aphanomyces astaci TaxID=112090 RepID=A0A425CPQ6_APHAT|nr:hypothetical protein B5M09_008440 [Aphanomyces astaci]
MARGEAWDTEEDVQLAKSWLAISGDPAIGAAQKSSDLNKRVYAHWLAHKSTVRHGDRSPQAIISRWKKVCPMLSSFNATVVQALKSIPSGWNEDGVISNELYAIADAKLHGVERTTILACWRIVRDAPKWRVEVETVQGKRKAVELQRPGGTKHAKAVKQAPVALDALHTRFVKASEEKASNMAKRHQLAELKFMFQVFAQDPQSEDAVLFNTQLRANLLLRARQLQTSSVANVARSLEAEESAEDDVDAIDANE